MTPDPYRNAYEKALADLTVISDGFEQLLTRKRKVENLIAALKPIFMSDQQAAPETSPIVEMPIPQSPHEVPAESQDAGSEAEARYSFLDVPAPLPESDGDPFERRVKGNFRFRGLAAQRSF